MPLFHILYFRDWKLEGANRVDVEDVLEAIDLASQKSPDQTTEIWTDSGRIAAITCLPAPRRHMLGRPDSGMVAPRESQITSVMKARLNLSHSASDGDR